MFKFGGFWVVEGLQEQKCGPDVLSAAVGQQMKEKQLQLDG